MSKRKPYYKRAHFVTYLITSVFNIDTFIDVGVNYGEGVFSVAKNFSGSCFGFEANPALRPFFEESLKMNDQLNVDMYWNVVSDRKDYEVTFFVDRRWSGHSSAVKPTSGNKRVIEVKSKTICLDDIFTSMKDFHCVFFKVDVEGFEPKVIDGFWKTIVKQENMIGFVEFGVDLLNRAGQEPKRVLQKWMEMFDVFEVNNNEDLVVLDSNRADQISETLRYHSDLFLVKLSKPQLAAQWNKIIKVGNLKKIFKLNKVVDFDMSDLEFIPLSSSDAS
jgi:FkbM family methyltransferase